MSDDRLPRMPWYPRDFRSATLGWPLVARGLYRELLDAQWDAGGLPNDEKKLREIAGISLKEWRVSWPLCSTKFVECEDGFLRNLRLENHRKEAAELAAKNRRKARIAAASRWSTDAKHDAENDASSNASRNAPSIMESQCLEQCPPAPAPEEEKNSPLANARGAPVAGATAGRRSNGIDPEIEQQIIAAYHELLPELPRIRDWTDTRRKHLRARVLQAKKRGKPADTVDYWRGLFGKVQASDFLMGRKTDWRCGGLAWIVASGERFAKIVEGHYDNTRDARG